jgi:hypothetical protein
MTFRLIPSTLARLNHSQGRTRPACQTLYSHDITILSAISILTPISYLFRSERCDMLAAILELGLQWTLNDTSSCFS